jgi:sortase (surface protein transpeptidase)
MGSPSRNQIRYWSITSVSWMAAAAAIVVVVLVVTASSGPPRPPRLAAEALPQRVVNTAPPVTTPGVAKGPLPLLMTRSTPNTLSIPAIGVATAIVSVGLTPTEAIEVPPLDNVGTHEAAWYDLGPSPGEIGTAVIVAHVDSYRGAAVFYKLGLLRPGDKVDVNRADHSTAVFTVTGVNLYPKINFPDSEVYGQATNGSQLRLITCGGPFDYQTRHYLDNTVVYATLTAVIEPETIQPAPTRPALPASSPTANPTDHSYRQKMLEELP